MRVQRAFAFVDLSGFTLFTDEQGDEASVEVLSAFRREVRSVATDSGVRIAKWLGDGCMLVSVEPAQLVEAVVLLGRRLRALSLPLPMHAGMAAGNVILLDGDDYVGSAVNLASRLSDAARREEILATPGLGALVPPGATATIVPDVAISGFVEPVAVVRVDIGAAEPAEPDRAALPG